MAKTLLSKSVAWKTYGGTANGYTITVTVVENSTNTANNTSNVTFTAKIVPNQAHWQGSSSTNRDLTITYAGVQMAYNKFQSLLSGESATITGTKTITHNATTGAYSGNVVVTIGGPSTYGTSPAKGTVGTWNVALTTLPRQATVSSAVDFTDEENPTMTYSNPAGNSVTTLQGCIASTDGKIIWVPYRDISKTATSYTFELTDDERAALRTAAANSNSLSLKYYIKTTFDTTNLYSSVAKTMTIVNANPTATIQKQETNTKVSAILGTSGDTIVKGVSNLKVTVTPSLKKNATLSSVHISNSNTSNAGANPYTFNAITNNNIICKVTDSRTNTCTYSVTPNMIDYIPINITSCDFKREGLDSNNVILNAAISCYTGTFGTENNSFTITYNSSNGSSGTVTNFTATNNTIVITDASLGELVADGEVATFTLTVTDLLTSKSASDIVTLAVPPFESGAHDFRVNGDLIVADRNGSNPINVMTKLNAIETKCISVFVQSTQPTATKTGDIWFSI